MLANDFDCCALITLSTAIFPCFLIHEANLGSVLSMASAKSLRLHTDLWKGQ